MTENSFNDINAAFNTKHYIIMFKIKANSVINIFMSEVFIDFNLNVNYAFFLFHFDLMIMLQYHECSKSN